MTDDKGYWFFKAEAVDSIFDLLSNLKDRFVYSDRNIEDEIELELIDGVINFEVQRGFFDKTFREDQNLFIHIDKYSCQTVKFDVISTSGNCRKGKIVELETESFNECDYDHLIYGIGCAKKPSLSNVIDVKVYQTDTHIVQGHVRLDIDGEVLNVIEYKTSKKNPFLVFDSKNEQLEIDTFQELCYRSSIGIGYVIGHFHNDYAITIKYRKGKIVGWKYRKTRGSIKSYYKPLIADYQSYMALSKQEKDQINKSGIKLISQKSMSILCTNIVKSSRFQVLILLLLESMNGSLISNPSLLSVALEELSSILLENAEKEPQPIKEKKYFREIRGKIFEIINSYNDEYFSKNGRKIIETKINNMNNRTNSSKLSMPFTIYDISLTDHELDALRQRNKFLHGETYHRINKDGVREEIENIDLFKTMLRLYHLTSILTLKLIGYNGIILNHVKVHANPKFTMNELIYRKI